MIKMSYLFWSITLIEPTSLGTFQNLIVSNNCCILTIEFMLSYRPSPLLEVPFSLFQVNQNIEHQQSLNMFVTNTLLKSVGFNVTSMASINFSNTVYGFNLGTENFALQPSWRVFVLL